ncbi:MAG: tRNA pseudouridine(13) synthase TruD [Candidatus ainarchaeum sp.]|nr:tRNA pseudouridine(13) synthase TruD [Candidatus ainarchaeum sp.]
MEPRIKQRYEDFKVQEISNGIKAEIKEFSTSLDDYGQKIGVELDALQGERKEQLKCVMQKRITEMQFALKSIANKQGFSIKRLGFAGTKDKRAVTAQFITIYDPDLDRLKQFRDRNVLLHSFEWSDKKLELGDLDKNYFEIIIRGIDKNKDLEKIIKQIQKDIKNGIPNAFGEQRFGSIRNSNHLIGKLFFEGKTKEAVELFLTGISGTEPENTVKARELVKQGNLKDAIRTFPKENKYEKAILNALIKNPNDYNNAWNQIPKTLAYLFVHAYQSYLFNLYLEKRVKEFENPLEKQDGDILDEQGFVLGPIYGHSTELAKEEVGKLEQSILDQENFSLPTFKIANFPMMSVEGDRRKIKLEIGDFKVLDICPDEFNENCLALKISFILDKGNYATTVTEFIIGYLQ